MSNTIQLQVAPQRTEPRGAAWLANAFSALIGAFRSAPAERSPSRDVQRARALAAEWNRRDPRSAADLSAAIDRFEQQHGL